MRPIRASDPRTEITRPKDVTIVELGCHELSFNMGTMQSVVAQTVKANPANCDIFLRVPMREVASPALMDRFCRKAHGSRLLLATTSGAA
jgi:hypothetical protein